MVVCPGLALPILSILESWTWPLSHSKVRSSQTTSIFKRGFRTNELREEELKIIQKQFSNIFQVTSLLDQTQAVYTNTTCWEELPSVQLKIGGSEGNQKTHWVKTWTHLTSPFQGENLEICDTTRHHLKVGVPIIRRLTCEPIGFSVLPQLQKPPASPCCRTRPVEARTSLQTWPCLHDGTTRDQTQWPFLLSVQWAPADPRWRWFGHLQTMSSDTAAPSKNSCHSHLHARSRCDLHDAYLGDTSRNAVVGSRPTWDLLAAQKYPAAMQYRVCMSMHLWIYLSNLSFFHIKSNQYLIIFNLFSVLFYSNNFYLNHVDPILFYSFPY